MTVDRVTATKDRSKIRFFISAEHLIPKADDLYAGGEHQKAGVPRLSDWRYRVQENYHLSAQYTPEKLMESYRDSILLELQNLQSDRI